MRAALPTVSPIPSLLGSDLSETEVPVEEVPLHEEFPGESESSPGLCREGESSLGANERRRAKVFRDRSRGNGLRLLVSALSRVDCRAASSAFEYSFRNGCGASLRC